MHNDTFPLAYTLTMCLLALAAVMLGGCAGDPYGASGLAPPPSRCMVAPGPQETLKAGDDLVAKHASLRQSYARETSKLKCVQRYVRTVRKG